MPYSERGGTSAGSATVEPSPRTNSINGSSSRGSPPVDAVGSTGGKRPGATVEVAAGGAVGVGASAPWGGKMSRGPLVLVMEAAQDGSALHSAKSRPPLR